MLLSRSVIRNNSFDLASNSGDKEDHNNDFMPNYSSSIKFRGNRRFLLADFIDTEEIGEPKKYSYFGLSSSKGNDEALKRAKQNNDSKKIIK